MNRQEEIDALKVKTSCDAAACEAIIDFSNEIRANGIIISFEQIVCVTNTLLELREERNHLSGESLVLLGIERAWNKQFTEDQMNLIRSITDLKFELSEQAKQKAADTRRKTRPDWNY